MRRAHSEAERVQLGYALELAEDLLARISALPGVQRSAYAGSLRRMRDTIGDVDLLVASDTPAPIMDAVVALPHVRRVLAHGSTRTSILTTTGLQVDLRVVPPAAWGAALQYFTGSKAHNIELRALALRMGLMVAAASARGYEYYAITDHAPLLYMQRMSTAKALAQRARIRELQRDSPVRLLHGTELNIQADGLLDWDDDLLAGFDVVVASVHSQFRQPRRQMTERLIRAVEDPQVNVIGHPTGRRIGHRPPIEADFDAVFQAAARSGTALEVNSSPDRLDLNGDLVRRARHFGVRFAVSTDAHAVGQLGHLRFGVATAQRAWAQSEEVINTYPLDKLLRFLAKRQRT